ncbi:MAG: MFS transporter [Sphingomonadales bacterium]|nr:MFS transporter [Sphingomonadales bacterium]
MDAMTMLIVASVAFVGSHFVLSHPLRAPLARRLGEGGFRGLYSLVALATFGWMLWAWRAAPDRVDYNGGDTAWIVATALMWVASVLLVGSFSGNPALPAPGASRAALRDPRGVFAITRHPMMWSFAIWGLVHVLIAPSARNHVLMLAIIVLALGGAFGQDGKKERLMGDVWHGWRAKTAYVPFAAQLTGRLSWGAAMPSPGVLAIGTLVWLGASWAHAAAGAPVAGLWRWIG